MAIDGERVGGTVAGRRWPRLADAGIGDGGHGFDLALPWHLADGSEHAVEASADGVPLRVDPGFFVDATPQGAFARTRFLAGRALPEPRRPPPRPASSYLPSAANAPFWLLGAGCLAYVLLAAYLTRHFSFFQDDYQILVERRAWNADALLAPQNQHLMLALMLFYKVLFVTVGLRTFWPYQLPVFGAHIACVLAIYVLGVRRSDRWIALVPAGLMLFLFGGFEDELWSINICIAGALAAGLWALVALDSEHRRGDVWACGLIALSVASHSVGLFLAAGIGVGLAVTNWRRLWVAVVPLALYGLWYLHYGQSDVVWSNLPQVPSYDLHIAGYGFAGILGLTKGYFGTKALVVGWVLLAGAIAYVVQHVRGRSLSTLTVVGTLAALGFWTATALARAAYGEADASRYLYVSAAFILLAVAGSLRPWRLRRPAALAGVVVLAGAVVVALGYRPLRGYATDRTTYDALVRVQLGAVQIAGGQANPGYVVDQHYMGGITAGNWLGVVRDLGSNAYSQAKILSLPAWYRGVADTELAGVEEIRLRAPFRPPRGVRCTDGGSARIVPGSAVYVSARRQRTNIRLRRLGPDLVRAFTLGPGARGTIVFPRDSSALPWTVDVGPGARLCPAAPGSTT